MEQTNITNDINQPVETSPINLITPKPNNIYKYLFFISLVILFGVIFYFYVAINNRSSQPINNNISEIIPDSIPTNFPTVTPSNTQIESSQIKDSINETSKTPNGWVEYKNKDLGFAFSYPKEYGEVKTSSTYGTEGNYGKLFTFNFTNQICTTTLCNKFIFMGAAAPNFGGIGIGAPMPISAGYYKNKDGSITERLISEKFGEWKNDYIKNSYFYDPMTIDNTTDTNIKITKYTPTYFQSDYLEGVLQNIEHSDYFSDDIIKISFNLGHNPFDITGFQFMTYDKPGETKNSEVLKSIAKTFRLLN